MSFVRVADCNVYALCVTIYIYILDKKNIKCKVYMISNELNFKLLHTGIK